jgi:hypothetical protein
MPKTKTHKAKTHKAKLPQRMITPRMTAPLPPDCPIAIAHNHPMVVRQRRTSRPHMAIKAHQGLAHVEDSEMIVKALSRTETETRGRADRSLS